MAAKGLKQADFAALLGVPIDRVKSLTSGRVTKLTPAEAKALVEKLHVRGDYLATGVEPIFQSPQEVQLNSSMELLKEASTTVQELPLTPRYQMLVRDILFGVALKKAELLESTIDGFVKEQRPPYGAAREEKEKSDSKKGGAKK